MDETTELFIEVLESRRRLAQSVLDAHTADAFGEPADPGEIEYYKAEVADCDAQLAELRNPWAVSALDPMRTFARLIA